MNGAKMHISRPHSALYMVLPIRSQRLKRNMQISVAAPVILAQFSLFDHEKHSRDHRSNFVNHQTNRDQGKKIHQNKPKMISLESK